MLLVNAGKFGIMFVARKSLKRNYTLLENVKTEKSVNKKISSLGRTFPEKMK